MEVLAVILKIAVIIHNCYGIIGGILFVIESEGCSVYFRRESIIGAGDTRGVAVGSIATIISYSGRTSCVCHGNLPNSTFSIALGNGVSAGTHIVDCINSSLIIIIRLSTGN